MKRVVPLVLVGLVSCSEAVAPGATTPAAAPATGAAADLRALASDATFGDLVRAARGLDRAPAPGRSCLLASDGGSVSFAADVALAIRPLPDAEASLSARLSPSDATVSVLSRWGRRGTGSLALVTFTHFPPGPLVALLLTGDGASLRSTEGPLDVAHRGPFPLDALGPHLAAAVPEGATLVVSADDRVPVRTLVRALSGFRGAVALASVLPHGTTPPSEVPAPAETREGRCDALPAPPPGAPEGDLDREAIVTGARALRETSVACVSASQSARVAGGGRVELLLRIGPDGHVSDACARADTIGDDAFRACLLGGARELAFSPPSPSGSIDVALPLRFAHDRSSARAGVCEP